MAGGGRDGQCTYTTYLHKHAHHSILYHVYCVHNRFVLEGGRFEYFDRPQDETSHTGKAFLLNPHSLTTYTTTENCFCIKANEDSDESRHWKLLAKDSRYDTATSCAFDDDDDGAQFYIVVVSVVFDTYTPSWLHDLMKYY